MSTVAKQMTAEELLKLPRGQFKYELVNGELITMSPTGHVHGRVTVRLTIALGQYVLKKKLGELYAAETGFKLASNPDTVLAPDLAFVSSERIANVTSESYWPGPPDLAIEVLSPGDRTGKVRTKVERWLAGGTRVVWIVDPKLSRVDIHSGAHVVTLSISDTINGGDVVPGFQMRVAEIFEH